VPKSSSAIRMPRSPSVRSVASAPAGSAMIPRSVTSSRRFAAGTPWLRNRCATSEGKAPSFRLRDETLTETVIELPSSRSGGHAIWWTVESTTAEDALRLLPRYVAERATATSVNEVDIP